MERGKMGQVGGGGHGADSHFLDEIWFGQGKTIQVVSLKLASYHTMAVIAV